MHLSSCCGSHCLTEKKILTMEIPSRCQGCVMNYGIVQLWHVLWHYGMFSPPHRPLQVTFHRQLLPMSDGGTVALDWTCDLDRVKAASQVEAVQPGLLAQATESRHQIPGTGMPRLLRLLLNWPFVHSSGPFHYSYQETGLMGLCSVPQ